MEQTSAGVSVTARGRIIIGGIATAMHQTFGNGRAGVRVFVKSRDKGQHWVRTHLQASRRHLRQIAQHGSGGCCPPSRLIIRQLRCQSRRRSICEALQGRAPHQRPRAQQARSTVEEQRRAQELGDGPVCPYSDLGPTNPVSLTTWRSIGRHVQDGLIDLSARQTCHQSIMRMQDPTRK